MITSLWSHEFYLIIEVLNLIWLLSLYVPRDSSLISAQFLVLNLDGSFVVLSNKFIIFLLFFIIFNLRSSIIFGVCSRDIYLSLIISSSSFVSKLFFVKVFDTFVIL